MFLSFAFALALSRVVQTQAFTSSATHRSAGGFLAAKPPATDAFDLEAIEAFEAELDKKAAQLEDVESIVEVENESFDDSENSKVAHEVSSKLAGKRLDAVLAKLQPDLSRSLCGSLIAERKVKLLGKDGSRTIIDRKAFKVEEGQTIEIVLPNDEVPDEVVAQKLPLDVLFEDEHMIVLNKAAGMVVHPAAGNWDGTVVNGLAYYLANESPYGSGEFIDDMGKVRLEAGVEWTQGDSASIRPGIVHRLDKGTTGVLVVAKTAHALASLSASFANRRVKKTYLAITVGNPGENVVIDKPIGRHPRDRQRMRVVPDPHQRDSSGMAPKDRLTDGRPIAQAGRRALSFVDTLAFDGKLSFVKVRIETGRTHQIRVHLQDRHTPIYGDEVYGLSDWNKKLSRTHKVTRPLLHAYRLIIEHPTTGEILDFKAKLADDMQCVVKAIYPEAETALPEVFGSSSIE